MPLNSLLATQAAWLEGYRFKLRILEQGRVRSVGDGIVWIEGLPSAAIEEILSLEDGSRALDESALLISKLRR